MISTSVSSLTSGCDTELQCPNGGWYHWKCVPELLEKRREEIDKIDKWMCPECRKLESKESVSKQSLTVATEAKGLAPLNGEGKESGLEVKESVMEEPDSVETN